MSQLFDPSIERRVRRLEEFLRLNDQRVSGSGTFSGRVPPPPSGLAKAEGIGTASIRWVPVEVANFKHYEVQFATDSGFTQIVETQIITSGNSATLQAATAGVTYYARVATVNALNNRSSWSNTLNMTTGEATFLDLRVGSASSLTIVEQTSGFTPPRIAVGDASASDLPSEGVYADLDLNLPTSADVLIFAFAKADTEIIRGDTYSFSLRVDGVEQQTYESRIDEGGSATLGPLLDYSAGRISVPGLGFPAVLTSGQHRIDLSASLELGDFNAGNGLSSYLQPVEFILAVWQSRN